MDTQGFLLHSRALSDHRHIGTFLTESGLMQAGYRVKKSTAKPQPFMLYLCSGRVKPTLTHFHHIEALEPSLLCKGEGLLCGLYLNEIIIRLLKANTWGIETHTGLYHHYVACLILLSQAKHRLDLSVILRRFEWQLFKHTLFPWQDCINCHGDSLEPDQFYTWGWQENQIICLLPSLSSDHMNGQLLRWLDEPITPHSWQSRPNCPNEYWHTLKRHFAWLIDHQCASKPLKSRELFNTMSAQ